MAIINPVTGKAELAKVFDTYKSSTAFDSFITRADIPKGHIIAAACKDDCITGLSAAARQWFAEMESKEISQLGYR